MGPRMKQIIQFFIFIELCLGFAPQSLAQPELLTKFRQYREKFLTSKKEDQERKFQELDKEINKTQEPDEKKLLLMAKALLALDLQQKDLAEKTFKQLEQEKNNLSEYVHYYYGKLLTEQQRYNEAKLQYQQILELSPNVKLQLDSQFQIAKINLEEKNFKQARFLLVQLEKRQRREETYPETIYQLAIAERGLGNFKVFCKWTKKLYSQYPQFSRLEKWGPQLARDEFEGQPTRCSITNEDRRSRIKNLQWAALGEKAFSEIQTLRGQVDKTEQFEVDRLEVGYWLHEGDVNKALRILLSYYELKKNNISYLSLLAITAARAGEFQAAVGSYYQVYKLAPRGKQAKQALYQAAFMSYQFQDYDGAARKFQEFMKAFSGSGLSRDAKWHLAWIRYLRGDFEGAQKSLAGLLNESQKKKRGWKSFPRDRVNYWMAMSLFRMGKFDQARMLFEPLAKDQLIGYYSIASQYRLKKLEKMAPKPLRLVFSEQSRRIARFSAVESMIPPEGVIFSGEENESEESLVTGTANAEVIANTPAGEEVGDDSADSELGPDNSVASGDKVGESAEDLESNKPSFANPVLVKRFERARDLMILGLHDWAKWDLYDIERKTSNREYLKNLMQEYTTVENFNRSSYIAQTYFGGQRALHGIDGVRYLWEYAYPKAYSLTVMKYSKMFDVPFELVWGIMRAESVYKKDVVSPVGALGLMQVMPGTGQKVSEMMNEKGFIPRSLLEPESAVKIGSRYLQRLLKKFDNNVPLVAAGYNAGPHRVKSWLSKFGTLDMDEFIEHIPFLETRNYVKKVVSNYQIYSLLYGSKKDSLSYLSDLLNVKATDSLVTRETWEEI